MKPNQETECACVHWARADLLAPYQLRGNAGMPLVTNHHPNCPHYNDSLIDLWKVTDGTTSFYTDEETSAREEALECDDITITPVKMHREIFENLPEFDGF